MRWGRGNAVSLAVSSGMILSLNRRLCNSGCCLRLQQALESSARTSQIRCGRLARLLMAAVTTSAAEGLEDGDRGGAKNPWFGEV